MISILCPTRKRLAEFNRMLQSIHDTAARAMAIEVVGYLDEDDETNYEQLAKYVPGLGKFNGAIRLTLIRGKRIVLSNMWNKCAAAASGDIFMQGNDDIVFRTKAWDVLVEKEFAKVPDRILMVHGNDGSGGASGEKGIFAVHPFVSRKWYEVLGYVTAPYFASDFGDTWINHIANAIDRRRYVPIVIEHMHYWWGKMPLDGNTEDRLKRHSDDNVELLYRNLGPLRAIDVEKMEAAIERAMVNSSSDAA